ncbi:hypothetical protein [Kitasatospora sp. NPDC086791]|uniref:hypothetical protein n=1 Tax=Kitasatospora sp. NPDC086791 TaxID=3155178 RepID=UPI00341F6B4B
MTVIAACDTLVTLCVRAVGFDSGHRRYELIRRLDPYARSAATSRPDLAAAVRSALAARLPELQPHAEDVTAFLAEYYGMED